MPRPEHPAQTTLRFFESWTSNSTEEARLAAELLSVSNETNRRPDTSHFLIQDGILMDSETGKSVLKAIVPGVEYQVAEDLQNWASITDEGISWWISPKNNIYPCNKAMVYQKAYDLNGNRAILYSAILFDGEIENPEEYRKTLFTGPDENTILFGILSWIEKVSGQKPEKPSNSKSGQYEAAHFAQQIRAGVNPDIIIAEMQATGFLGQNPISCPRGLQPFSNYIISRTNLLIFSPTKNRPWSFNKEGTCVMCGEFTKVGPCKICEPCNDKADTETASFAV